MLDFPTAVPKQAPLERKIDAATTRPCYGRMYALYGLTQDEVNIIEGKN